MTTVKFFKKDNVINVSATDHAYGCEMVCNAVSVMMYSLEAWLLNNPESVKEHTSSFESGKAVVSFIPKDFAVYTILNFMIIGLAEIEHTYGKQYISLSVCNELIELTGARFK